MAGSLNRVQLLGHLGKDPEIRSFQNGGRVCNLSVATSETWKDRNTGEKQERTEWHRVAIFSDGLIGVCEQYLRKGAKVFVEGQLQTRKWQDQNGNDRYSTEIVIRGFGGQLIMVGDRGGGGQRSDQHDGGYQSGGSGGSSQSGSSWNQGGGSASGGSTGRDWDDLDDEIPF